MTTSLSTPESPERTVSGGIPTEQAMARAIKRGWMVGLPGMFAVIFIGSIIAGASAVLAAEIAVFPSLVCGGFLCAAIFIGLASARAER